MAIVIRLTDGTTTININTAPIYVTKYPIQTPKTDDAAISNLGDGQSLAVPKWENVVETIQILIKDTTAAAVKTVLNNIESMFDRARQNRYTNNKIRVYIEVQFGTDADVWRSEILVARLNFPDVSDQLWMASVEGAITITRRYYWEGPETAIPLSSGPTGTPTTGYVTVYNNDDASSNTNWFQVAADVITGVIPAPIKLEINNNSGGTYSIRTVRLGNYVFMTPASIDPIRRNTEAAYTDTSWSIDGENDNYRFLLNSTLLGYLNGQYCRIIVAYTSIPSSATLARARLQHFETPAYLDMVIGEQVRVNGHYVLDLGSMPIPPGVSVNGVTYLTLTMEIVGGSAATLDWLQIMPAGFGLYRELRGLIQSADLVDGASIIDNGYEDTLTIQDGSDTFATLRGINAPLHVWPDVVNRYRMVKEGFSSIGAGEVYRVKAWYRPRRLTI